MNKNLVMPVVLMGIGFGSALLCVALIQFAGLSRNGHGIVIIVQSFSVGIGSIGLGTYVSRK